MIQPGLERIGLLLKNTQFPWKAVHVAGTNGKGSICGHTSNLLTRRLIKNGRFTSPHIINRWDCITIDNEPVSEQEFRKVEDHFIELSKREEINASEFELLTATAFTLFNEKKVDVGIVEVGMGGKLDATNILNNQVVSVISKIARDHQAFLGDSLAEIAQHKAGILRPNVPFIVNPMNELDVHAVIDEYAREIGAGPRILPDTPELRATILKSAYWTKYATGKIPWERDNAIIAFLAYLEVLKSLGLNDRWERAIKMFSKMKNTKALPGRLHSVHVPVVFGSNREVLVDGAHNPDAAEALSTYVWEKLRKKPASRMHDHPNLNGSYPVTWVLAMTEGRDPRIFLRKLLRPNDFIITTDFNPVDGMPWVKPMNAKVLLNVAKEVQAGITGLAMEKRGAYRALCAAKYLSRASYIILTGSLYLVGDFFREHEIGKRTYNGTEEFPSIREIDREEKQRVESMLSGLSKADDFVSELPLPTHNWKIEEDATKPGIRATVRRTILSDQQQAVESEEARKLREEIEQLEAEMQALQPAADESEPFVSSTEPIEEPPRRTTPTLSTHASHKGLRFEQPPPKAFRFIGYEKQDQYSAPSRFRTSFDESDSRLAYMDKAKAQSFDSAAGSAGSQKDQSTSEADENSVVRKAIGKTPTLRVDESSRNTGQWSFRPSQDTDGDRRADQSKEEPSFDNTAEEKRNYTKEPAGWDSVYTALPERAGS